VTSIGIDHVEWLGPDRESIGREKAGIFRAGRPAICGDPAPPHSLQARADELATPLYRIQHDFGYEVSGDDWTWWGRFAGANTRYEQLPFPALRGAFQLQNAATAVMAMQVLTARLPVSVEAIRQGLAEVSLPGRFQMLPGPVTRIFDVAHNPHGAEVLARSLLEYPCAGRTLAVFSMLADKDIAGVVGALRGSVHHWQVAALPAARAATTAQIMQAVRENAPAASIEQSASVGDAWRAAWSRARPGDRVVVFGSFYTVAEAMQAAL
jgi:dihydrofolate synthase/folylpolyglutamate synthase